MSNDTNAAPDNTPATAETGPVGYQPSIVQTTNAPVTEPALTTSASAQDPAPVNATAEAPAVVPEPLMSFVVPAPVPAPRTTVPAAPAGLVGANSNQTVGTIKAVLDGAVTEAREQIKAEYAHGVTAFEAAINAIKVLPTMNLHPTVAKYKAEVLEFLRGKHEQFKKAD